MAPGSPARTIRPTPSASVQDAATGSPRAAEYLRPRSPSYHIGYSIFLLIIGPSPAAGGRSEGWTARDRLPHPRRMSNKTSRDRVLKVLGTRSQGTGNAFLRCWGRVLLDTACPRDASVPPVVARKQTDKSGTFRLEAAPYAPPRRRGNGDSRRGRSVFLGDISVFCSLFQSKTQTILFFRVQCRWMAALGAHRVV